MSESNKCNSCSINFDIQARTPVTLPCGHLMCETCVIQEYLREGSNQCPKVECKKVSFIDPQNLIDEKIEQRESQQEKKGLDIEIKKDEVPLQEELNKQIKQIKVQILTQNEQEINILVNEGDTVEQLKQNIEIEEGIDPDFYELYQEEKYLHN